MKEEPVTIVDRDVLKVLSNDTRIDILKLLSAGGRNPSFVAKKLNKSDATIVEHLKTLENVGLVKKTSSPGKKWVFYSLTDRGQGIVSSKSKRLVIILSSSLIAFGLGAAGLFGSLAYNFAGGSLMSSAPEAASGMTALGEAARDVAVSEASECLGICISSLGLPVVFNASAVLILLSVVGLAFYFYKKRETCVMKL